MAGTLAVPKAVGSAEPRVPAGYPRSYDRLIEAAEREKTFVIYTTMFPIDLRDAFADFRSIYPFIKIEYDLESVESTAQRVAKEVAEGAGTADLVWLHSMDVSVKLINDGYALAYNSPEKPNLPDWAVWRNEGWAITAEPAVLVYNKKLVPEHDVPRSRDELKKLLRTATDFYRGKIGTYNAAASSVGFLFFSEDARITRDTWSLVEAIADCNPVLYPSSEQMVNAVRAGEIAIAYNVLGTHAFEAKKVDPSLGVVLPSEYTQMTSNIAFIPKEALHPAVARLFLDYLLSERGQAILARRSYTPANINIRQGSNASSLGETMTHAMRMGPGLLANVDKINRRKFVDHWKQIMRGARIVAQKAPDDPP